MKKHFKIMLALLLVMAMFVGVLRMPVSVSADEESGERPTFTINAISGAPQQDVIVNGEYRTIYCMQYNYLLPTPDDPSYGNDPTKYYEANAEEMYLTADQLAVVQRLMYAGYPYNATGALTPIFNAGGSFLYDNVAPGLTQNALWALMAKWGVPGNDHYDSTNLESAEVPGYQEAYTALMDFVENGTISQLPGEFVPELVGHMGFDGHDGEFMSGAVKITNPEGFVLAYTVDFPEGVYPVDEDGEELWANVLYDSSFNEIGYRFYGGETFYLRTEDPNALEGEEITFTATAKVPTDVKQYMTNDTGRGDKNDGQGYVQHPYQTMLSVGISTASYSGSATLKAPVEHIHGEKIWIDQDPASRPESITIRLHANGVEIKSQTVTVKDDGTWGYSFPDLPTYDSNGEIKYTVTEDQVPNYSTDYNGWNIINTYTPGKTSLSVEKEWEDADNNDGLRPSMIKVYLVANGVTQSDNYVVLNEANEWEATFHELPMLDEKGKAITYSVEEDPVAGYTSKLEGTAEHGFVLVNTHKVETVTVSGEKTWVGDTADARPESITIRLHANGVENDVVEVKPNADGKWTWSFTDLPKYIHGKMVEYTITEDAIDDYDTEIHGYNVTNTFDPGKTSLSVEKIWSDKEDQDRIRPFSVTINLLADGKKTGDSLELSEENLWEGTFHHLPELNPDGTRIEYTIEEEKVEGYEAYIFGDAATGYTVLNVHEIEKISISGEKTWVGDSEATRPEYITIRLHANGIEIDSMEVYPDSEGKWEWYFHELDEHEGGEDIIYTITEDALLDYDYDVSINGYNVTNTYDPGNTSLTVGKNWDDDHDNDGIRPEKVTVYLVIDGVQSETSVELSADNKWEATFHHLPERNSSGRRIIYTVVEAPVAGYESVVTGDYTKGYLVINSHQVETINVSGTKVWDDESDKDGIRPESITVYLMNGDKKVDFVVVTAETDWKWSFENVKKFENGGKEIKYTVTEAAVEGYTTKITGSLADGFVITNTHEIKEDPATKPDSNTGNANANNGKPDTGDRSQVGAYMVMLMASMMGIVVSTILNKKERKLRKSK